MKTNYFSLTHKFLLSFVGLLGLTVSSCGTYQNKSYYDNDGIYGGQKTQNREVVSQNNNDSSEKYKDYFASNANNFGTENNETFTDVNSYTSQNDTVKKETTKNYSSWGSNDHDVTINVYSNNWGWGGYYGNYWGYRPWRSSYYYGYSYWDNFWYSPYWGGYYGPSYGWYNPYYCGYYGYYGYGYYPYGHYNYGYYDRNGYAYGNGRRDSGYSNRYSNNGYSTYQPTRNYSGVRGSSYSNTNSTFQNPRGTFATPRSPRSEGTTNNGGMVNPRSSNYQTPTNEPRPMYNPRSQNPRTYDTPRSESPRSESPRSESPRTYDVPRSESPRSYDSPRSSGYSTPRSSGGGFSGGGYSGGGGSRGGGRRG